jgi:hypothetical protein
MMYEFYATWNNWLLVQNNEWGGLCYAKQKYSPSFCRKNYAFVWYTLSKIKFRKINNLKETHTLMTSSRQQQTQARFYLPQREKKDLKGQCPMQIAVDIPCRSWWFPFTVLLLLLSPIGTWDDCLLILNSFYIYTTLGHEVHQLLYMYSCVRVWKLHKDCN